MFEVGVSTAGASDDAARSSQVQVRRVEHPLRRGERHSAVRRIDGVGAQRFQLGRGKLLETGSRDGEGVVAWWRAHAGNLHTVRMSSCITSCVT